MLARDDWWKAAAFFFAGGSAIAALVAGMIQLAIVFYALAAFCGLQAIGQIIDGRPRDVGKHEMAVKSLRTCLDEAADKISRLNPQHENAKADCDRIYRDWEWSVRATLTLYREDELAAFERASRDTTGNPMRKGIAIKRWGWTLDRLDGQVKEIGEIIARAQSRLTWAK
jgi:hypothetical protein